MRGYALQAPVDFAGRARYLIDGREDALVLGAGDHSCASYPASGGLACLFVCELVELQPAVALHPPECRLGTTHLVSQRDPEIGIQHYVPVLL